MVNWQNQFSNRSNHRSNPQNFCLHSLGNSVNNSVNQLGYARSVQNRVSRRHGDIFDQQFEVITTAGKRTAKALTIWFDGGLASRYHLPSIKPALKCFNID